MPEFTLAELAALIDGQVHGDGGLPVRGLAEPGEAGPDDLAVAMSARFLAQIVRGRAQAAIVAEGAPWQDMGLKGVIVTQRPRLAMAGLTTRFAPSATAEPTIHPSAIIDSAALIDNQVSIGPHAVVEAGARIGAGSILGAGVFVGAGAHLGAGARLAPHVIIAAGTRIGANFVGHAGVVIGGDGFSFVTPEPSGVDEVKGSLADPVNTASQAWAKIASIGGVVIGDDVEIGANSSVDAGTIRPTHVGNGTKIDALVQVGHNARVGENCLLCAHVAVGGSAVIGAGSVLGGQVGVADNVTLGEGVIAGGATKILSNVPQGRAILGYPAIKMEQHVEIYKALRRLPRLISRVAGLEKAISKDPSND